MKYHNYTRILIPVAMVTFVTIDLSVKITNHYDVSDLWLRIVIVISAAASAIGVELWGITAGDNLESAFSLHIGEIWASIQALAYAGFLTYLLADTVVWFLPIVAMLAYIAAAWSQSLQIQRESNVQRDKVAFTEEQRKNALETKFEYEQRALNAQAERERIAEQNRLSHEERLAEIEAQADVAIAVEETKRARAENKKQNSKRKLKPAQGGQHQCKYCDFVGKSPQAVSAHLQFCKGYNKESG